jgi:predicted metal-dependent hydrolase
VRAHLQAGIAVFNEGEYHAAHDAWEDRWLDLEEGTDDERFLHGLIQFTAAVHHATNGNDEGARGLAESAAEYLDGLGDTHRGVALDTVRPFLSRLAADPALLARAEPEPPQLTYEGRALAYDDLGVEATAIAAEILAEEMAFDPAPIRRATTYAREDLSVGYESSEFVALLFDFVREPENRGIVHDRLAAAVSKRAREEDDVAGLFD